MSIKTKLLDSLVQTYDDTEYWEGMNPMDSTQFHRRFTIHGYKFVMENRAEDGFQWRCRFGTNDMNGWFSVLPEHVESVVASFAEVFKEFVFNKHPSEFVLIADRDFVGSNLGETGDIDKQVELTFAPSINNLIIREIIKDVEVRNAYDFVDPNSPNEEVSFDELSLDIVFRRK